MLKENNLQGAMTANLLSTEKLKAVILIYLRYSWD